MVPFKKKCLKIKAVFSVMKLFLLQNQDNKNTRSSVSGPRCKNKIKRLLSSVPHRFWCWWLQFKWGGKSGASTGLLHDVTHLDRSPKNSKPLRGTGLLRMRGSAYG